MSLLLFNFKLNIDDEGKNLYAGEFISVIKSLNNLFAKLVNEI